MTDLVGHTDLVDLMTVYRSSALIITHDSGPLHMAQLVGTPMIALFGPTLPNEKINPSKTTIVMWSGGGRLPCCPCYDGKGYANCSNNVCMQMITVNQVMEAARLLLFTSGYDLERLHANGK